MGSCLGKPSHKSSTSGGGRVLGPAPNNLGGGSSRPAPRQQQQARTQGPGRTLVNDASQHEQPADARQAAALAAHERANQERTRSGQLGAKLAQEKSKKRSQLLAKDNNDNNNEPLIYD